MRLAALLAGCVLLTACASQQDTPPAVTAQYTALKAGLDPDTVGQSIGTLEAFKVVHAGYRISAAVDDDIGSLREQAKDRYHLARELARGGDPARAEKPETLLAQSGWS
jgi:hypothetical protein